MGRSILLVRGQNEQDVREAWQQVRAELRSWEGGHSILRGSLDFLTRKGYESLLEGPMLKAHREDAPDETSTLLQGTSGRRTGETYALVRVEVSGVLTSGSVQIFSQSFNAVMRVPNVSCNAVHIGWGEGIDEGVPRETIVESKNGTIKIITPTHEETYALPGIICPWNFGAQPKSGNEFYEYPPAEVRAEAQQYTEAELDSIERIRRARNTGRITAEKPDFIGAWAQADVSGTFELFIERREGTKISGRIEDIIGAATFEGTLDGDHLVFTKKYTGVHGRHSGPEGIRYEGDRGSDGKFRGKFTLPKYATAPNGTFEMTAQQAA